MINHKPQAQLHYFTQHHCKRIKMVLEAKVLVLVLMVVIVCGISY